VQDCKHRPRSCDDSASRRESGPDQIFGKDRKQNGTLEIEKNLDVPEKQYIVGTAIISYLVWRHLSGPGGWWSDHIDCGTKSATYVATYIPNVNWTGVAFCPSSDAAALIAH